MPPETQDEHNSRHETMDDIRMLARDEANRAILAHLQLCPLTRDNIANRLRTLEISYGRLIGFLLGSGILGGAAGGIAAKLLN